MRRGGFANDLDTLLRNLQDGQTLGIPISPDSSLAVAEILACAVDKEIHHRAGLMGFRFMDDYEFGFTSRSAAEAALAEIELALAEFELGVNPRKTSIDELPIALDRGWATNLNTFRFSKPNDVRREELIRYFDLAFEFKVRYPTETVLAYAIARLRPINARDWEILRDLLLQCALVEPGCFEAVITELVPNQAQGLGELSAVIRTILDQHAPLAHGSELVWALWAAVWFQIPIDPAVAGRLDGNPDPFVAVLALYARHRGIIPTTVQFPAWQQLMKRESLYDEFWILAYEADLQGWLPSTETPNHVDADPLFGSGSV